MFFGTSFGTFLIESPGIAEGDVPLLAAIPPMLLIVGSRSAELSDALLRVPAAAALLARVWPSSTWRFVRDVRGGECSTTRICSRLIAAGCLFMTVGGVSAYAITMDVGGRHVAAVFSTMNMCGSIGAAAFPKYAGWLVERTGDWNHVLLSIAAIYVAAAVCWALLNPDGTLFEDGRIRVDQCRHTYCPLMDPKQSIDVVHTPQALCRAGVAQRESRRRWGFITACRRRPRTIAPTGVHRPLLATALVLESQDRTSTGRQVIVAIDHCLLWAEDMRQLHESVCRATNVAPGELQIAFSHTHAAGLMDRSRLRFRAAN